MGTLIKWKTAKNVECPLFSAEYYGAEVQLDALSAPTPEPASLGLLGLGGLGLMRRRRKPISKA